MTVLFSIQLPLDGVLIPAAAGIAKVAVTIPATTDAEMAAAVAEHGQANGQTLEHGWAFWLVSPQVEARRQVASERTVHTFSTVDEFWRFCPISPMYS
jgi:hypothetical protein